VKYCLALIALLVCADAVSAIGVVVDAQGSACGIERSKKQLAGGKGSAIESMDTYITGGCVANITFKDNTKVRITENSRLLIDDFVFDPKSSDAGRLALKVTAGTVRYASGQIAKNNPQRVDIKTPSATIAVRGTDFNMVVDESGQSLVMLVPSCREDERVKEYELEENMCKVGEITVSTLGGTVTLDQAFESTYVVSSISPPTPPVVVNTTEGKVNNLLIISQPAEIQLSRSSDSQARDLEDMEADSARQMQQRLQAQQRDGASAEVMPYSFDSGRTGCNPTPNICVRWSNPTASSADELGQGTAFRTSSDHHAEIKTEGYDSNTHITVTHDDSSATALIGSGNPGGNTVIIRQTTGIRPR